MKKIVEVILFSLVLAGVLAGGVSACANEQRADDEQLESSTHALDLPVCGIWVDVDEAAADARAQSGKRPNLLVYAFDHTTCSDAIAIGNQRWPGRHIVRYAEERWRAVGF